jgi:long-subunit fatty acid transport protein
VASTSVDGRMPALASPQLDVGSELDEVRLKRTVVAPSYTSRWGNQGSFGVTAVLAYQRFASLGLGESSLADDAPMWPVVPGETSYGAGLRLDIGNTLLNRLSWSAAYQSRVNMDALNSLRGVYTDPGQFDIPASASVGVSYALTPSLSFDVGAQRVKYSEVTPFTSPALPRRFLALLGSGASPVFAWQDLTVYSAGWTWRDDAFGNLELRYTTRQQPSPTSALLSNALDSNPADHTVAVGYSRSTGQQATLRLQAIYSSAPYFLGVPSYRSSERVTGNQVEYEAAWSWRF